MDNLLNYAALRAYGGVAETVYIYGAASYAASPDGTSGMFYMDGGDLSSADNGGTIIVDASGRRWKRVYSGPVNVRWFGAAGDGSTDDTTAMQAAHNTGAVVYYPATASHYKFTILSIAQGGIIGQGPTTLLKSSDTTSSDVITYTGNGSNGVYPLFRDFSLSGPNTSSSIVKTAGVGLRFNPTRDAGALQNFTLSNINFADLPDCLDLSYTAAVSVETCTFYFYRNKAIRFANPNHVDVGDSHVTGCTFFNGTGATYANLGAGIYQESGGGLRISNNKFNGGNAHYTLNLLGQTSDLIITGNSFENCASAAIGLSNPNNTAAAPIRFENVVIGANQFARNTVDITANAIPNYLNTSYWDNVSITGNSFTFHGSGNSVQAYTARNWNISGNSWFGEAVGNNCVYVDATCSNFNVDNQYLSTATTVISAGSNINVAKTITTGSASGVTDTAAGSIFINSAVVTVAFGVTYATPPQVLISASSGLGATVAGVSTSSANIRILGYANGQTVNFSWRAEGVQP